MSSKPLISVLVPYRDKPEMDFMTDTWTPLYAQRAQLDYATLIISKWLMNDMHGISRSRNALIGAAQDRQSDYVYFLDSDMTIRSPPSTEALRLLLEAIQRPDIDIISGMYLERSSRRICARKWNDPEKQYEYYKRSELEGKLTQVDAVGMGCCLIDTRIFNSLEFPWFRYGARKEEPAEDLFFCERSRELGFKVWIHGDVVFDHWGKYKYTLDDEAIPLSQ